MEMISINTIQFLNAFDYIKSTVEGLEDLQLITGDEYSYDFVNDVVTVALEKTHMDRVWEEFMIGYVKEVFDYDMTLDEIDIFSLLHEIGHAETFYTFSTEQIKQYVKDVDVLNTDDFYSYRQLDIEYTADKWAIDYMRLHGEDLKQILK